MATSRFLIQAYILGLGKQHVSMNRRVLVLEMPNHGDDKVGKGKSRSTR